MKVKNNIKKVLISILTIIMCMGTTLSLAASVAVSSEDAPTLSLQYPRYSRKDSENKYSYALRTTVDKPIYQILDEEMRTNYYCLNAAVGASWQNMNLEGSEGVEYNVKYENFDSDLESLKADSNSIYANIAKSPYINQILWILDNLFIPNEEDEEENQANKEALMARAGLVRGFVDSENKFQAYKFDSSGYNDCTYIDDGRSKTKLTNNI